ncbi:MAG: hypothetical protein PHO58_02610 [Bacilli bacterium]|nr:hypothetical protein [Bacilli bacterium]
MLISLVFVIDNVLIYFIGLKKINNGIIHNYFLLMILIGFFIMELIVKKIKERKDRFDFAFKK